MDMGRFKELEQEIFELKETLKIKEKELCAIKQNIDCKVPLSNNNAIDTETTKMKIGKLPKWAIERYSRQILLPDIGVEGQARLMSARVFIVGAGGLGCPAAVYLAGAGVGEIGIVDYDEVDVTNIHRQILHSESDQNISKAESAANSLRSINSKIKITAYNTELSPANAVKIASNYDVILDCTDNVPTRYMLNDLSILTKIPLISGSALKMEGQLTIYGYREYKNEMTAGPCYRCVFPRPPPAAAVGSCSAQGVAGPVPGVIGTLQALEAIKLIVGKRHGELLVGRMLIFDGEDMTFRTVKLRPKNSKCQMCSAVATIKELTNYEVLCKMQSKEKDLDLHILPETHRISATELSKTYLNKRHLLIDVRSEAEYTMCHIDDALNFPLDQLHGDRFRDLLGIISRCSDDVIFICRRGNDSQLAAQMVLNEQNKVVKDVSGGLHAWARDVDRDFPVY